MVFHVESKTRSETTKKGRTVEKTLKCSSSSEDKTVMAVYTDGVRRYMTTKNSVNDALLMMCMMTKMNEYAVKMFLVMGCHI